MPLDISDNYLGICHIDSVSYDKWSTIRSEEHHCDRTGGIVFCSRDGRATRCLHIWNRNVAPTECNHACDCIPGKCGWPASAMALATARGAVDRVLPGVAVGLLGYAIGNYTGFAMGALVRGVIGY